VVHSPPLGEYTGEATTPTALESRPHVSTVFQPKRKESSSLVPCARLGGHTPSASRSASASRRTLSSATVYGYRRECASTPLVPAAPAAPVAPADVGLSFAAVTVAVAVAVVVAVAALAAAAAGPGALVVFTGGGGDLSVWFHARSPS